MAAADELYADEFWIEFYDSMMSEAFYTTGFEQIYKLILKYNPKVKTFLELACGTGRYTKYFAKVGFAIKATDISPYAIAKAQKRVKNAKFELADMSRINEPPIYDVVGCFFESFRYHKNYAQCKKTLKKVFAALKPNGLFLCDFAFYPSKSESVFISGEKSRKLNLSSGKPVDMRAFEKGLFVVKEDIIYTKGNYDFRTSKMTFLRNGIKSEVKEIQRSPLLRIPEDVMIKMLEQTGFKIQEIIHGFRGESQAMLFVAQKVF